LLASACALPRITAAADAQIWRGNFLVAKQGALFNPCRSNERLVLDDATPGRALEAAYRELARRRGRPIFVEFTGLRINIAGTATATIRATRFARAQADGPGCREDLNTIRLRAYGFNPFIQLEVGARSVLLRRLPSGEPTKYQGAALRVAEGEARYEGSTAESVMRVRVRAKTCRETLSSGIFSYQALIEVDDERYVSCAYWGDLGPIPDLPR
jgi:uncharacterized membrane protein